jgi:hypothetical protein
MFAAPATQLSEISLSRPFFMAALESNQQPSLSELAQPFAAVRPSSLRAHG